VYPARPRRPRRRLAREHGRHVVEIAQFLNRENFVEEREAGFMAE
jgi:hypothetical protein